MVQEINVIGSAKLKEIYTNEKDKLHYAVLSTYFKSPGRDSDEMTFEIPITEEYHSKLKEMLAYSKAESPVLTVKGNLEFILSSKSFN